MSAHKSEPLDLAIRRLSRAMLRLMAERDVSITDLAEACGVSYDVAGNWVNGRTAPKLDKIATIRAALGCTWEELMG